MNLGFGFGNPSDSVGPVPSTGAESSNSSDADGDYGPLKPVGFVNYGEYDATVRAYSFYPLGSTEPAPPSNASTVSVANDGIGDWPNSSRYISVPMGNYSWCIDWETGEDLDEDGYFDYYHYIQDDPTILDENDSDVLEFC